MGRSAQSHSHVAFCSAGLVFTDEVLSPSKELMASLGDGEVHGMEEVEAEGIEDSVDEEVAVPVDDEPIQTGDFTTVSPPNSLKRKKF